MFAIKHKIVEGLACFSVVAPSILSAFTLGPLSFGICLIWWHIVGFDNDIVNCIATLVMWIVGFVLGYIGFFGEVPMAMWVIYCLLFVNTIYYLMCEALEILEIKQGKTPLEIRYKEHLKLYGRKSK